MTYLKRTIERTIDLAAKVFPAVVLTGPRRAGKTFLLRHHVPQATYVQLEDPDILEAVKADPNGFLDSLNLPVVIDEMQQVPELFPYIRSRIDVNPSAKGQWYLTGSQETLLMRGVSESMAGRAAILRLLPFSVGEDSRVTPFRGGYPEALDAGDGAQLWYSSYVQTYLERDVRSILAVRNLTTFHRFIKVLATRHGQMLNKTDLAAPLGISVPTLTEWLNVLEMSGIVLRVPPFYRNAGKRLVKTPKIYFTDSGLVCHLLGIRTEEELLKSPFYGAVFEGHVIVETLKAQLSAGEQGEVFYFRDEQGLEVDLLFSPREGEVELVECKTSSTVFPEMAQPMQRLARALKGESLSVRMNLVHVPSAGKTAVGTLGEDVAVSGLDAFLVRVFA